MKVILINKEEKLEKLFFNDTDILVLGFDEYQENGLTMPSIKLLIKYLKNNGYQMKHKRFYLFSGQLLNKYLNINTYDSWVRSKIIYLAFDINELKVKSEEEIEDVLNILSHLKFINLTMYSQKTCEDEDFVFGNISTESNLKYLINKPIAKTIDVEVEETA